MNAFAVHNDITKNTSHYVLRFLVEQTRRIVAISSVPAGSTNLTQARHVDSFSIGSRSTSHRKKYRARYKFWQNPEIIM